jgi:hypothetical protein
LVEQMTLNHRVPGSSPGAPTKLFKHLAIWSTPEPAAVYSFVLFSSLNTADSASRYEIYRFGSDELVGDTSTLLIERFFDRLCLTARDSI